MKSNAKKYIQLDNQIFKNRKKADYFESGQFYDFCKMTVWRKKEKIAIIKKQKLELTIEEKKEIENYYQIGQMFDY